MSEFTIYHNPRCSKSRTTLGLLEERGINPKVVLYLEQSLDATQVRILLGKLGMTAVELVRSSEDAYKICNLSKGSSEDEVIAAMVSHPKLIERPIVVKGDRAVLGRPPENVLELIG